jgi:hypothetical protein
MEGITHEVEASDTETTIFVFVDMGLLEADDVNFLSFRYGADDAALCGRQPFNVELQDAQCWADGLKVSVQIGKVVVILM